MIKWILLPCVFLGYESYQLLWNHKGTPVCLIHCTVLWSCYGPAGAGSAPCQWDGWTTTDAQWLPQFPRHFHRVCSSNQTVLPLHRSHPHLLQVDILDILWWSNYVWGGEKYFISPVQSKVTFISQPGSQLMMPGIWFSATWLSTQIPTMKTLLVITTRSAGHVTLAWDWWSMMSTCRFFF